MLNRIVSAVLALIVLGACTFATIPDDEQLLITQSPIAAEPHIARNPFYPIITPTGVEYAPEAQVAALEYVGYVAVTDAAQQSRLALLRWRKQQHVVVIGDRIAGVLVIGFSDRYLILQAAEGIMSKQIAAN